MLNAQLRSHFNKGRRSESGDETTSVVVSNVSNTADFDPVVGTDGGGKGWRYRPAGGEGGKAS